MNKVYVFAQNPVLKKFETIQEGNKFRCPLCKQWVEIQSKGEMPSVSLKCRGCGQKYSILLN